MTKVLNIISDSNIGGAGRCLMNFLRYYDRETFEVSVALPTGSQLIPHLVELNTPYYEVEGIAEQSYSREAVKELEKLIEQVEPEIVHTHSTLSGRIAARRKGKKVVYTRHSAFPVPAKLKYPPGRWVNKFINEYYSDHIIAVSPAAAENLTDGGISPKRITIMMNGVAPVARSSDEVCQALKAQWGVEPDDFVLGILARIETYKGHLNIVEAADMLARDGRKFKVLIAGVGDYEAELRQEVAKRGLEDKVLFMGFVTDVAPVLSIMDVQLNASYGTETSSLSILEGMSMGLPAVISDYGGNPWLVTDGDNGLMFPKQNSEALYRCICKVMDDRAELERMAKRSVEVFHQKFTGQIFAQNVEAVYRKVLEKKG